MRHRGCELVVLHRIDAYSCLEPVVLILAMWFEDPLPQPAGQHIANHVPGYRTRALSSQVPLWPAFIASCYLRRGSNNG